MFFDKNPNLLNYDEHYDERNLFGIDSNVELNTNGEFLIFEGYKIHLKKKPKSQSLRICIGMPSKKKYQDSVLDFGSAADSVGTASRAKKSAIRIEVRHPPKAKLEDIMDFCQKHKEWIAKTYARYESQLVKTDELLHSHGGKILLFGEWIERQNLATIAQEILSQMHQSNLASKPPKLKTTKQQLSFILLCHICERTQALARQMQLEYGKIAVRETFTRFGSCTHNRLSFSLLLICASKQQIDYVIIHELAHIVHKNHSHRFWNLVEKHCKEWRILRKSLQDEYSLFRLAVENL